MKCRIINDFSSRTIITDGGRLGAIHWREGNDKAQTPYLFTEVYRNSIEPTNEDCIANPYQYLAQGGIDRQYYSTADIFNREVMSAVFRAMGYTTQEIATATRNNTLFDHIAFEQF